MGELEKQNGLHVARLRRSYPLLYAERSFFVPAALTVSVLCGLLMALAVIIGQ